MNSKKDIPEKTVERLTLYRRLLTGLKEKGLEHIYSHQLAEFTRNTAAQIRRDIMVTGYTANARKGYTIEELIKQIDETLAVPTKQKIALIGIGNLGRAILAYFNNQHSTLSIEAAFDNDDSKVNRVIAGCRCYHLKDIEKMIKSEGIELAIITVPGHYAQDVADKVEAAGIKGILNFAPVPLRLPDSIYADRIDITTAIEKVAYFANKSTPTKTDLI
jgi:redox-sensing transcriptional repressor